MLTLINRFDANPACDARHWPQNWHGVPRFIVVARNDVDICIRACMHTRIRACMHTCVYISLFFSLRASVYLYICMIRTESLVIPVFPEGIEISTHEQNSILCVESQVEKMT